MIHKNVVLDFNSLFLFDLSFSISHLLTPLGCSLKLNLSAGGSNMKTMMMPMLILLGTAATFTLCCYYCHRMLHNWKLPGIWNMFRILDSTFYFTLYVGERKIRQMFGVFSNSSHFPLLKVFGVQRCSTSVQRKFFCCQNSHKTGGYSDNVVR